MVPRRTQELDLLMLPVFAKRLLSGVKGGVCCTGKTVTTTATVTVALLYCSGYNGYDRYNDYSSCDSVSIITAMAVTTVTVITTW